MIIGQIYTIKHQLMMINQSIVINRTYRSGSWSIVPIMINPSSIVYPSWSIVLWWNTFEFLESDEKSSIEISNLDFIDNNLLSHQNEIYAFSQYFGTLVQGLNLMSLHRDSKSNVWQVLDTLSGCIGIRNRTVSQVFRTLVQGLGLKISHRDSKSNG